VVESEDGARVGGNLVVVVLHDGGCVVLPVIGALDRSDIRSAMRVIRVLEVPEGDGLASDTSHFLHLVVVVSEGWMKKIRTCKTWPAERLTRTDESWVCTSNLHDGL
jgi:hypothetical protein